MLRVRGVAGACATAAAAAACLTIRPRCDAPMPNEVHGERITKRIVFIRHGQGYHNLDGGRPAEFDPALTPQGEKEARAVFADGSLANFVPTLALVSPLWRTLQTCTLALRQACELGHECPRIVATDGVREHNNCNPCNHRRVISQEEHAREFPEVDLSLVDPVGPPNGAEWVDASYKDAFGLLRARARSMLDDLAARPDEQIAVFTHGTFIRAVISEVLDLNVHHWGACPPTGTPVEVWQVEGVGSEGRDSYRYWELARPASIDSIGATAVPTAGPSTKRPPLGS